MAIGRKIGLNDDKGYIVAIVLAIVIVAALLVGYYEVFPPKAAPYNTIYILDSQNKAENYPQVLVANQNSTFNVPVTVINHVGETAQYEVLVKITSNLSTLPVNDTQPFGIYQFTLQNGQSWQKSVPVSENVVGNYYVVFELWQYNSDPNAMAYQFTYNSCVLPIQVINS